MHGSRAIKTTPYGARNYNCRNAVACASHTNTHTRIIGPLRANFMHGILPDVQGTVKNTVTYCGFLFIETD